MVEISCIIINYNTAEFTIDCVKSIWQNNSEKDLFEIIVVDNASKKEDSQLLKNFQKESKIDFKLVESRINLGFGGGNMLGVQYATNPTYYAFINNDTLLFENETLRALKDFMDHNSDIGVCSPQMLDQDKKFRSTIDHFSTLKREFLNRSILEKLNPAKYPKRKQFYKKPVKANYVQGSFMFTRAIDFEYVGGFDTNLFLFYEESDLCLRLLKRRNKETYLYPSASYIHYKGMSTRKDVNILIKIELKLSLLYNIRKHQGWLAHQVLLNYLRLKYSLSCLIKPSYFPLTKILLKGAPISYSLKNKQQLSR